MRAIKRHYIEFAEGGIIPAVPRIHEFEAPESGATRDTVLAALDHWLRWTWENCMFPHGSEADREVAIEAWRDGNDGSENLDPMVGDPENDILPVWNDGWEVVWDVKPENADTICAYCAPVRGDGVTLTIL